MPTARYQRDGGGAVAGDSCQLCCRPPSAVCAHELFALRISISRRTDQPAVHRIELTDDGRGALRRLHSGRGSEILVPLLDQQPPLPVELSNRLIVGRAEQGRCADEAGAAEPAASHCGDFASRSVSDRLR